MQRCSHIRHHDLFHGFRARRPQNRSPGSCGRLLMRRRRDPSGILRSRLRHIPLHFRVLVGLLIPAVRKNRTEKMKCRCMQSIPCSLLLGQRHSDLVHLDAEDLRARLPPVHPPALLLLLREECRRILRRLLHRLHRLSHTSQE